MLKYFKSSGWGEVWVSESNMNKNKIVKLSFELIPKLGVQLFQFEQDTDSQKNSKIFFNKLGCFNLDE